MQLTITKVYRTSKNKDGQPLINKKGQPYERLAIQCSEYGEKWLSGFSASWNTSWVEGDTVEVEVTESGQYLNISRPDPMFALGALSLRVAALELKVSSLLVGDNGPKSPFADDIDISQIPF